MLFNLRDDPNENKNLAADLPPVAARLERILEAETRAQP
jgi:hypothetical protein